MSRLPRDEKSALYYKFTKIKKLVEYSNYFYFSFILHQQTRLFLITTIDLISICQERSCLTMLHTLRESSENFG